MPIPSQPFPLSRNADGASMMIYSSTRRAIGGELQSDHRTVPAACFEARAPQNLIDITEDDQGDSCRRAPARFSSPRTTFTRPLLLESGLSVTERPAHLFHLIDRFLREPSFAKGHVVDFLELPHWPIFNVADICVVSAACLIALLSIRGIGLDGSRLESSGTNAESTADMKTDAKNEADTDE